MALEVSVSASAQRLQAQRDRQATVQREQRTAEANEQVRQQERLREERLRAQEVARQADRNQISRALIRDAIDDRAFDDQRIRDILDQRTDDRNARLAADNQAARADAEFSAQQRNDAETTAALSNPSTSLAPVQSPDSGAGQEALRQLLAERNSRLNEREAAQRQFAAQQQQDLSRAQRSIETLRNDPSSFPASPTRGEVVDVQA